MPTEISPHVYGELLEQARVKKDRGDKMDLLALIGNVLLGMDVEVEEERREREDPTGRVIGTVPTAVIRTPGAQEGDTESTEYKVDGYYIGNVDMKVHPDGVEHGENFVAMSDEGGADDALGLTVRMHKPGADEDNEPADEVKPTGIKAGDYVLVRSRGAGVHTGVLRILDGQTCELTESRRLWYWKCKRGAFLSGVAVYGLDDESKLGATVDSIYITEVCEVIAVSAEAEASIRGLAVHRE